MIEIKLNIDGIDYYSLIPVLVPMIIKNKLAAKATSYTAKKKLKGLREEEINAYVINFLHEHKEHIIENINEYVKDNDIKGYLFDFDAVIV